MIRKILFFGMACSVMLSCSPNPQQIERIMKDGIEVVVNRLEPYKIAGEPSALAVEELFVIDTEDEDLAASGLADIRFFDIDSKGDIFLCQSPRKDTPLIFKFNSGGRFMASFGKLGQGPGEIQHPEYLAITPDDELAVMNRGSRRIMFFDTGGDLRHEIPFDLLYFPREGLVLLDNGNLLVQIVGLRENRVLDRVYVRVLDPGLTEITSIFDYVHPIFRDNEKINIFAEMPVIAVSREYFFIGFDNIDEDIHVYDLEGNLIRKIRRETRKVKTPVELLKKVLNRFRGDQSERDRFYAPAHLPAYQHMFCDDAGRLYVMTPEKDQESGRNIYDIFNRDGFFIARKDLGYYDRLQDMFLSQSLDIRARHGRIYCLREKESGFKQLIVYRMIWE